MEAVPGGISEGGRRKVSGDSTAKGRPAVGHADRGLASDVPLDLQHASSATDRVLATRKVHDVNTINPTELPQVSQHLNVSSGNQLHEKNHHPEGNNPEQQQQQQQSCLTPHQPPYQQLQPPLQNHAALHQKLQQQQHSYHYLYPGQHPGSHFASGGNQFAHHLLPAELAAAASMAISPAASPAHSYDSSVASCATTPFLGHNAGSGVGGHMHQHQYYYYQQLHQQQQQQQHNGSAAMHAVVPLALPPSHTTSGPVNAAAAQCKLQQACSGGDTSAAAAAAASFANSTASTTPTATMITSPTVVKTATTATPASVEPTESQMVTAPPPSIPPLSIALMPPSIQPSEAVQPPVSTSMTAQQSLAFGSTEPAGRKFSAVAFGNTAQSAMHSRQEGLGRTSEALRDFEVPSAEALRERLFGPLSVEEEEAQQVGRSVAGPPVMKTSSLTRPVAVTALQEGPASNGIGGMMGPSAMEPRGLTASMLGLGRMKSTGRRAASPSRKVSDGRGSRPSPKSVARQLSGGRGKRLTVVSAVAGGGSSGGGGGGGAGDVAASTVMNLSGTQGAGAGLHEEQKRQEQAECSSSVASHQQVFGAQKRDGQIPHAGEQERLQQLLQQKLSEQQQAQQQQKLQQQQQQAGLSAPVPKASRTSAVASFFRHRPSGLGSPFNFFSPKRKIRKSLVVVGGGGEENNTSNSNGNSNTTGSSTHDSKNNSEDIAASSGQGMEQQPVGGNVPASIAPVPTCKSEPVAVTTVRPAAEGPSGHLARGEPEGGAGKFGAPSKGTNTSAIPSVHSVPGAPPPAVVSAAALGALHGGMIGGTVSTPTVGTIPQFRARLSPAVTLSETDAPAPVAVYSSAGVVLTPIGMHAGGRAGVDDAAAGKAEAGEGGSGTGWPLGSCAAEKLQPLAASDGWRASDCMDRDGGTPVTPEDAHAMMELGSAEKNPGDSMDCDVPGLTAVVEAFSHLATTPGAAAHGQNDMHISPQETGRRLSDKVMQSPGEAMAASPYTNSRPIRRQGSGKFRSLFGSILKHDG